MNNIILCGATEQVIVLEEIISSYNMNIVAFFIIVKEVKSQFKYILIFHNELSWNNFKDSYFVVAIVGSKWKNRVQYLRFWF